MTTTSTTVPTHGHSSHGGSWTAISATYVGGEYTKPKKTPQELLEEIAKELRILREQTQVLFLYLTTRKKRKRNARAKRGH